MSRPTLEVADIFQQYGAQWRQAHKGHLSLGQLKTMSAIEHCRTITLGGHLLQCQSCKHTHIAYNSCRNRHCPKCQASAMTHHPHIHGIVPGGGLSADGQQWVACKPGFFLPVRVLSRLFRRLFLELLMKAYQKKQLHFYHQLKLIESCQAFSHWLKPLGQKEWVVYAKRPFAGPKAVLAYLSRYTHRVAIANSRLVSLGNNKVTFKWKDYRHKEGYQQKNMTLSVDEFIQRFLIHILPKQFHRIRHIGLFANASRKNNLAQIRQLLVEQEELTLSEVMAVAEKPKAIEESIDLFYQCPDCGGNMIIIEIFKYGQKPRASPVMELAS